MMYLLFFVIVGLRLWWLIRKYNAQGVEPVNLTLQRRDFKYPPYTDLTDAGLWDKRRQQYDFDTTNKRYGQAISLFNEMKTKALFRTGYESDELALSAKLKNFSKNPAKHFSAMLLFLLMSVAAWAQSAADVYKQAEKSYKNNEFANAAEYYKQVLNLDSSYKQASVLYKTGLCYQKLKDCNVAKGFFARALQASPADGGASSISKFTEKIKACGFSVSDLTLSNALSSTDEPLESSAVATTKNTDAAKNYYSEGEDLYDRKKYSDAIEKFSAALKADSSYKRAATLYKIALCYQKKKDCDEAKRYFSLAYVANPENGGASSLSKFKEKANKCGWSEADVATATSSAEASVTDEQAAPQQPKSKSGFSFVSFLFSILSGFIVAWILFRIYKKTNQNKREKELSQAVTTQMFDENTWEILKGKYPADKVQKVRDLFEQKHQQALAAESPAEIAELHWYLQQLKETPEAFFDNELTTSSFIPLMTKFEGAFYCFFTAELIPEGRSAVVEILHPSGQSRKVWALQRIASKIQTGANVKVRVHRVNGQWVHWSKDLTWSDALATQAENARKQAAWQGEAQEVQVFNLFEIFTEKYTNYMSPHPDALVQAVLTLRDNNGGSNQTGYNPDYTPPTGGNYDSGGSRMGDVLTGMIIGSQLSGDRHHHHHHDYDRDNDHYRDNS
ncbi:Tetratricopeptide repeat-containing protein [Flexibacter flexilis DSM 6793]|uniref:Tetratricopeptide repeat-containing protein n=1 Tax=Flexibacter flexilis DSM 6793 TaxID=927664 RepID=A0A1I1HR88_9BACT|nr:tetratricopeptide repeat protein [Flexibacter flexilis]SFC26371.1 Tetratricopeptide repeat-containing protein [Flexibacter flexilis DSM 6793]